MADNLTVETRGAAQTAPRQAASDDGAAAERAELEKLRDLVKAKHGKALDERTLKAILQRRKAKQAQRQKTAESRETFAKEQAKEKVSAKAQDIKTRAQKTTGAKGDRGADGLTSEDRQSVRSDPKAGPKLPPTQAKATTPEKANELLGLMLASVQIEDEVFDLEAYARTLRQAPPSKPKATPEQARQARALPNRQAGHQPRAGPGQQAAGQQAPGPRLAQKPSGLSSTNQGSTNQKGQAQDGRTPTTARPGGAQQGGSQPGASSRAGGPGTRQPATAPGKAGGQGTTEGRGGPTPAPMASQTTSPSGALGMPTSAAKLGFRAGASDTRLTSTNVSDDGLFNAGGGLITNSSFDGMHFNWDAFFSLFLIRSLKDMQEWRKLMKELRRLEGDLAVQGYKTDIALTKMRQHFERKKEFRKGTTAFGRAREAFHRGQVRAITGHDPSRVGETTQQMRDLVEQAKKRVPNLRGGPHLTESQIESLPRELQDAYRDLRTGLRTDGGINAEYEMARNTYNNAGNVKPPLTGAQRDELRRELSALEQEKDKLTARMMRDPVQAAVLNEQRNAMQGREKQLLDDINELRGKKNAHEKGETRLGTEELAELESKLTSLQKERFGLLRRMMILDSTMGRAEPRRDGQTEAYHAAIAKTVVAERGPVRSAIEAIDDELRHMEANPNETSDHRIDRLEQRLAELRRTPSVAAFEAGMKKQAQDSPEVAEFDEMRRTVRSLEPGSPEAKPAWARFRELRDHASVKEHVAWRTEQYEKTPALAKVDQVEHMLREARQNPDAQKDERRGRLTKERGRIAGGVGPHWSPAFRAGDNALRDSEEYLRWLVDGDPTSDRPGGKLPIDRFLTRTTEGDVDMDALASDTRDLEGIVNAGRHIQEARRDFVHDLKLDNTLDRVDHAIDAFSDAADKSFGKAVNQAVQGAIGMAKRHRKEVDGEIRAVAQRAQGMINQLVQLLGVSRSR